MMLDKTPQKEATEVSPGKEIPKDQRGAFQNGVRVKGFDDRGLPIFERKVETKESNKETKKDNSKK